MLGQKVDAPFSHRSAATMETFSHKAAGPACHLQTRLQVCGPNRGGGRAALKCCTGQWEMRVGGSGPQSPQ